MAVALAEEAESNLYLAHARDERLRVEVSEANDKLEAQKKKNETALATERTAKHAARRERDKARKERNQALQERDNAVNVQACGQTKLDSEKHLHELTRGGRQPQETR